MALATRCPQCGTAFRLVPDQLRLHGGLVRCGACSAIFDGRQAQFEIDGDNAPSQAATRRDAPAAAAPPPQPAPPAPVTPPAPEPLATPVADPTPVDAPVPTLPVSSELPPPPSPSPVRESFAQTPPEPVVVPPAVSEPEPPAPVDDTPTIAPTTGGFDPLRRREPAPRAAPPEDDVGDAPAAPFTATRDPVAPDEPLPLAPRGDSNLLHAPEPLPGARREPRLGEAPVAPATTLHPPIYPDDAPGSVRAAVIDDGRLHAATGGRTEPSLRVPTWEDTDPPLDIPELRRESADPDLVVPGQPPDEVGPVYAWDQAPEEEAPPPAEVVEGPGEFTPEPPPETPRRAVWPWVLGSLLALLVAGAQALWLWRDDIATQLPIARPLLDAMCEPLSCKVGYPRRPDQLSIESSSLEPWQTDFNVTEGGPVSKRLALRLVLRNRHTLPQPWPSIELTLTNLSDTPVVRRVLAPADYLPPDMLGKPMPARSERAMRIAVEPPTDPVSGYRLSVFFP